MWGKKKKDLAVKQIAGLIFFLFIYLFMWGNNAYLIVKVTDSREKPAEKSSRECMLMRAKRPPLLLSSVG